MSCDFGEDIALVPHVLDLLEADDCDWRLAGLGAPPTTDYRLRTIDLAQNLERKHLVLVARLGVPESHEPYACKSTWSYISNLSLAVPASMGRAHPCPAS
jgi:hypothetical protein